MNSYEASDDQGGRYRAGVLALCIVFSLAAVGGLALWALSREPGRPVPARGGATVGEDGRGERPDVQPARATRETVPEKPTADAARLAAFDARSFESTQGWARGIAAKVLDAEDNGIRLSELAQRVQGSLKGLKGQEVDWQLPVASITESDVRLRESWAMPDGGKFPKGEAYGKLAGTPTSRTYLVVSVHRNGDEEGDVTGENLVRQYASLQVGREVSRDRAASLRPGGNVRVSARIRRAEFVADLGGIWLQLANVQAR